VEARIVPARRRSPWLRVPAELESVCARATARDRRARYPSVAALIADVQAFQSHREVAAHRYGLLERFVRLVQRHPAGSLAGGVASVLAAVGAALAVSLAAWAREEQARAEAQALRAENEVRARAVAERRAGDAETALEKGRRAAGVLRAADAELGDVMRRLKDSFYSAGTGDDKRAAAAEAWGEVEAFEGKAGFDPGSQAAWLAAKGWLCRLAGREEESRALFARSRAADPDLAYGSLFEGMVHLAEYLRKQNVLPWTFGDKGMEFGTAGEESPELRRLRDLFMERMEEARRAKI
jgi:hypothetical protein